MIVMQSGLRVASKWLIAVATLSGCVILSPVLGQDVRPNKKRMDINEEMRCADCAAALEYIGGNLSRYFKQHGKYPLTQHDSGTHGPPVSWRVAIQESWASRFLSRYRQGEPWNSAHNLALVDDTIVAGIFACPSDHHARSAHAASYLAVTGPGTVWSEVDSGHLKDPEKEARDKILVIEVPEGGVPWTQPKDLSVEDVVKLFKATPGLTTTRHARGLHYLTAGRDVESFGNLDGVGALLQRLKVIQLGKPKELSR